MSRREMMQTALLWAAGIAVLGTLLWLPRTELLFWALCAGTHVEKSEADLDGDDYVSVKEAGYACNVESRSVMRKGRRCTEYYNRADWRTIELVCETSAGETEAVTP